MSVLPTACQSALNNALTGAGFTRAATWQAYSGGTLGAATDIRIVVESDQASYVWSEEGRQSVRVRAVQVRLVGSTSTARLGDVLNYDSVAFTIDAIGGTDDLPMWRATSKTDYGRGFNDRFRAEGR